MRSGGAGRKNPHGGRVAREDKDVRNRRAWWRAVHERRRREKEVRRKERRARALAR